MYIVESLLSESGELHFVYRDKSVSVVPDGDLWSVKIGSTIKPAISKRDGYRIAVNTIDKMVVNAL